MFARTVSFHLKPGRAGEFTRLLDQDVIPVLRKQKGFQDEISLVAAGGAEAVGISVWNLKEDAETYARGAYAGVLKALAPVAPSFLSVVGKCRTRSPGPPPPSPFAQSPVP